MHEFDSQMSLILLIEYLAQTVQSVEFCKNDKLIM